MWLASVQFKNLELNIRHSGTCGILGIFRDLGEARQVYVQMPDHSNRLVEARKLGFKTCKKAVKRMVPGLFFSSENLGENILQDDKPGKKRIL